MMAILCWVMLRWVLNIEAILTTSKPHEQAQRQPFKINFEKYNLDKKSIL